MTTLLPKHLPFTSKKQTAAILVLLSIHAAAVMAVVRWESRYPSPVGDLATPFLYCQLGLLAWWACLEGPRRFWRAVLSLVMLVMLIALASHRVITGVGYLVGETHFATYTSHGMPWDEGNWLLYFLSVGGFLTVSAPFIFAAIVILGWILPCKIIHRRGRSDVSASGTTDRALSDWQFSLGDLLAATAALAAVTGLIAWIQPYPTWILEYGYCAMIHTRIPVLMKTTDIVTITLGTWFSGYFLLGQSIRPRRLAILVLVAAMNCVSNVLISSVIFPISFGVRDRILVPSDVWITLQSTFYDWIILAGSFLLLRAAGFRITRTPSRVFRRWAASE